MEIYPEIDIAHEAGGNAAFPGGDFTLQEFVAHGDRGFALAYFFPAAGESSEMKGHYVCELSHFTGDAAAEIQSDGGALSKWFQQGLGQHVFTKLDAGRDFEAKAAELADQPAPEARIGIKPEVMKPTFDGDKVTLATFKPKR